MRRPSFGVPPISLVFALAFGIAACAAGQVTGAALRREQKPVYPEGLLKIQKQGNVLVIGRIDREGRVQDAHAIAATNPGFVDASLAALKAWQFKPATRSGAPIDSAVNVGFRFRLEGKTHNEIPRPILGDFAIFASDTSGKKTAPDGLPIRRGTSPRLRVEAVLDVTPAEKPAKLALRAEALSPKSRRIALWNGTVNVPARAASVPVPFSAPIGADWEDGIWQVQISVNDVPAGGGQFWLAGDPAHFDFAGAMSRIAAAAVVPPPAPVPTAAPAGVPRPLPTATPRRK
ncbi:MAG: energy transducer TonB [Acidobacteriota bacterium]|nr:energy transducer TonB [Acidobacteriota bacterium]